MAARVVAAMVALSSTRAMPLPPPTSSAPTVNASDARGGLAPWWYGPTLGPKLGPKDWARGYGQCGQGHQSPINLEQAVADPQLGRLELTVKQEGCAQATFENTEHYWEVTTGDCGNASVLRYLGKEWVLQQFHWHSPSEHTIGGGYHDMECHMVHAAPDGSELVIGVFLSADATVRDNVFLEDFWSSSAFDNQTRPVPSGVNPYEGLLPADPAYFAYQGSSTTPPCALDVEWIVFRE